MNCPSDQIRFSRARPKRILEVLPLSPTFLPPAIAPHVINKYTRNGGNRRTRIHSGRLLSQECPAPDRSKRNCVWWTGIRQRAAGPPEASAVLQHLCCGAAYRYGEKDIVRGVHRRNPACLRKQVPRQDGLYDHLDGHGAERAVLSNRIWSCVCYCVSRTQKRHWEPLGCQAEHPWELFC